MKAFKKSYHQSLFTSFAAGLSAREAARAAGVSEPTACKFRKAYAQDIQEAQKRSTEGVLGQLQGLLPDAVVRLEKLLNPPPPPEPLPCSCGNGLPSLPHSPFCDSLKVFKDSSHTNANNANDIRTIRTIIRAYETMRNVDFEKRLKALEKAHAEAVAAVAKSEGKV